MVLEVVLFVRREKPLTDIEDISYSFKYPEINGKQQFTIRQIGVYQQYDSSSSQGSWMLIFPNYECGARSRLMGMRSQSYMSASNHPLQYHVELLSADIGNWRAYIGQFEQDLETFVSRSLRIVVHFIRV